MRVTRVCEVLGIQYPIIQAPMNWITTPELVAAVSNAGGLGVFGPNAGADRPNAEPRQVGEQLRAQIREAKKLTAKPFGVCFEVGGGGNPFTEAWVQVAIEEGVRVAYTSAGSPEGYTGRLHEAGMKVLHIVTSVKHARKAEEAGIDIIVVGGYEAGGMSVGRDEIPLFVLLPQVADAVETPVVAGCGIADERGLVAAFALGADGICMGTRFEATSESRIHPKMKQAIVDANETATVAWGKKLVMGRALKNKFTEKYFEMENNGATAQELQEFVSGYEDSSGKGFGRMPGAFMEGDLEWGLPYTGAVSGLVREVKGAEDVVRDIVAGIGDVLARINSDLLPSQA